MCLFYLIVGKKWFRSEYPNLEIGIHDSARCHMQESYLEICGIRKRVVGITTSFFCVLY
jgi:hypothetical protein